MNKNTIRGWVLAKPKDIKLDGITIDVDYDSQFNKITRIDLQDKTGNRIQIAYQDYGIVWKVPAPPKKVEIWKITGGDNSFTIDETFSERELAESRLEELQIKSGPSIAFHILSEEVEEPTQ